MLAQLSRCAWKVLSAYLRQGAVSTDAVPGEAVAVHTFGDFQQFNPHPHIIATDGSDDTIPVLVESQLSSKAWRRNWARLI